LVKPLVVNMLDMDEVLMEQAKAKAQAVKDNQVSILTKMPSFTLSKTRQLSKNPSFFKKMFSMRNMDKVFADGESDDGSQLSQEEDEGTSNKPLLDSAQESKEHAKDEDDDDDESEHEHHGGHKKKKKDDTEEAVELDSKYPYFDPPLPKIGQPVDMDRLINRNKKAEYGLQALMEMVTRDVDESLRNVKTIPVTSSFDRIAVTEEQSAYISKVRTTKDIDRTVERNVQHIQKALNYRKSALIMMNSNYSHQLVRLIEPIYVNEARTIVKRAGDAAAHKASTSHH
jgi:hypothetical protein